MNPHQPTPTPTIGVDFKTAAAITSFSEKELRDAVNRGEIPAIRRGTRIALDYPGLVAWFQAHPPVVDKSA